MRVRVSVCLNVYVGARVVCLVSEDIVEEVIVTEFLRAM